MVLNGKRARTFGESQAEDLDLDDISIGCGTSSGAVVRSSSSGTTRINRRRLQMVDDASACNNVTNFFCWMSCLDIPEAENAVGYITEGYSLYCLDPATLASTGNRVSAAQEKCNLGGVIGGSHDDSCAGSWQPTAPGVPSQEVIVDKSLLAVNEAFCYGGTSMYMDGFHWTDPTCVIYLFPNWVLTTAGLLAFACIGTIFFGVALEAVIWKRRSVVQSAPAGWKRVAASTSFYGLQLTMGYTIMLVIMTYSGPLFMCAIIGLMGGHAVFNAGNMKAKVKSDEVTGNVTELCEGGQGYKTENDVDSRSNNSDNAECIGTMVPEGITPCCQNSL